MEPQQSQSGTAVDKTGSSNSPMKLLFVEMGVGYDQHGQDITAAEVRACRDAISSNSIPAFRIGSIPGVSFEQMNLLIKLGVPHSAQRSLDIEGVKSVFPYGKILNVEVVDGGLICSSGVCVEEMERSLHSECCSLCWLLVYIFLIFFMLPTSFQLVLCEVTFYFLLSTYDVKFILFNFYL